MSPRLKARKCPECGRVVERTWRGYCGTCYKRLIWRPANGAAVERDREASRRWKRENLGAPGQPTSPRYPGSKPRTS